MKNANPRAGAKQEGHPVVAALLDAFMWSLRSVRAELIPRASGRVLELGIGTGGNVHYYRDIDALVGVDPDPHMLRRARKRARKAPFPADVKRAGAEDLPFPDESFDTVVATWVLCTIPDPARATLQMRRVLRPGGVLLFAEHTRSRFYRAARLQTRLTPMWSRLAGGCHLDRESVGLIRSAGFRQVEVQPARRERYTLLPVYMGTARP